MADPAALALQTGVLLKQLYQYGGQVKNASEDISKLCHELSALRGFLGDLESQDAIRTTSGKLRQALADAEEVLDNLQKKLAPKLSKSQQCIQSLKWPFKKGEVYEMLQRLERVKTRLLLDIIGGSQNSLEDMRKDLKQISMTVQNESIDRLSQQQEARRRRLEHIVAPVSTDATHKSACKVWEDSSSGTWFLKGPLQSWLGSPGSSEQLMYLHGKSGGGKTVLVSHAIEHVKATFSDQHVSYFYCSYNNAESQEYKKILGSWLAQIQASDLTAFENFDKSGNNIPLASLEDALVGAATSQNPVLLVLDALNESQQADQILERLYATLRRNINLKCLLSCTHIPPSGTTDANGLTIQVEMKVEDVQIDIENYVKREITRHEVLKKVSPDEIVSAVSSSAQGMFRWASCQMSILAEQVTPKLVRRTLQNLPGTLDETYATLLARVPSSSRPLVREALIWTGFSKRPLDLIALIDAVVFEIGDRFIDDTCRIQPPERLMELCQGLVTLDSSTNEVALAHSTVRSFLESDNIHRTDASYFAISPGDAQQHMRSKYLSYLLMDPFDIGFCTITEYVGVLLDFPLLSSARNLLKRHTMCKASDVRLSEAEILMYEKFLLEPKRFGFWLRMFFEDEVSSECIETEQPLYYAASLGLVHAVRTLLDRPSKPSLEGRTRWFHAYRATPLLAACLRGHVEVARLLLEAGANPNCECVTTFRLMPVIALLQEKEPWVERDGDREIHQLLLQHGAVAITVHSVQDMIHNIPFVAMLRMEFMIELLRNPCICPC